MTNYELKHTCFIGEKAGTDERGPIEAAYD
jgi:hypothetical protein